MASSGYPHGDDELALRLQQEAAADVDTGSDTTGSSDGSEDEDEEQQNPKSPQEQDKNKDFDKDDFDDKDKGGSSGAMASTGHEQTPCIIIDLLEKDITEYSEEELVTYEIAIRKKMSEAMDHYAKVRVQLKMLKKQKKKEENKRLRAEKMKAMKEEMAEMRAKLITINFVLNGTSYSCTLPLTSTVKDMRQEMARVANIKVKKVVKGLSIYKASDSTRNLCDSSRKTLGGLGVSDGDSFIVNIAGQGGVKKTKKAALKTEQKDKMTFETVFGNAIFAWNTTNYDFSKTLSEMSLDDVTKIRDYLKHNKSRNEIKISRVVEFLPIYKMAEDVQKKLEASNEMVRSLVVEKLEETYGAGNDFDKDALLEDLNKTIGIKEHVKSSSAMDAE